VGGVKDESIMFVLSVMRDVVRVSPEKFDRPLLEVLEEELDIKYSNKVVVDLGMCVCVHDFTTVEDAIIYPSDGGAFHKVGFRLLVFRPFVGEICVGTISGANEEGIHVSLEFFEDVFIPHYFLPQPAEYDARAKLWVWKYDESDDEDGYGRFNTHEQVRFRVESVSYARIDHSSKDGGTGGAQGQAALAETSSSPGRGGLKGASPQASVVIGGSRSDAPIMKVTGSCGSSGLGLVIWSWE